MISWRSPLRHNVGQGFGTCFVGGVFQDSVTIRKRIMGDAARQALFISHASPEDNPFTLWLGAKLTALGYEVFADVLRLRGGDDWDRILESAIRDKAVKFLLAATPHGVQKQGVRNEITIATETAKRIKEDAFIVPLRLAAFDAPLQIAHAQYIDFEKGWAQGLSDLLSVLSEAQIACTGHKGNVDLWQGVHLKDASGLIHSDDSQIGRGSSSSHYESRNCRQRHASRSPPA